MNVATRVAVGSNPGNLAHVWEKKTHKHKQIRGIVTGLGGCQEFVYVNS